MAVTNDVLNVNDKLVAGIVRSVWDRSALGALLPVSLSDTGHQVICPSLSFAGATWVSEAAEIPVVDGVYAEVAAPVCKVAALSQVSTEAMDQLRSRASKGTSESFKAYDELLYALRADLAGAIDSAFCQDLSGNSLAPNGALATEGVTEVEGGLTVDAIVDANSRALALTGAPLAGVIASVGAVAALAKTKAADSSNEYLYSYDADGALLVQGVRVLPSPVVSEGVDGIAVPSKGVVVGGNVLGRLERSNDYAFNRDVVTVRGVMYAGFAFGVPAAVSVVKAA